MKGPLTHMPNTKDNIMKRKKEIKKMVDEEGEWMKTKGERKVFIG